MIKNNLVMEGRMQAVLSCGELVIFTTKTMVEPLYKSVCKPEKSLQELKQQEIKLLNEIEKGINYMTDRTIWNFMNQETYDLFLTDIDMMKKTLRHIETLKQPRKFLWRFSFIAKVQSRLLKILDDMENIAENYQIRHSTSVQSFFEAVQTGTFTQ